MADSPGTPSSPVALRSAAALAGALALGGAVFALSGRVAPPTLRRLPDFALIDQNGEPVSRSRLAGRTVVADLIFTRCADVCPAMTGVMARLQREMPADTLFLSVTVDPDYDTPAVLRRYAERHGARAGWLFVTGDPSAVRRLAGRGFALAAAEGDSDADGDEGAFIHSSKIVLLDRAAAVRGYYDSDEPAALRRLVRDAALVGGSGVLPRLNAALNSVSALLLLSGLFFIRRGDRWAHRNCMVTAVVSSALFLGTYLTYHARVGSIRFPGEGPSRIAYLALLGSHTLLAATVVPLVAFTLARALRGRFDAHRRIARLTLPVWLYVSVTGVCVFWALYAL